MNKQKNQILLKSIKLIDPKTNSERMCDVLMSNKKIFSINDINSTDYNKLNTVIYDCNNLVMSPGFIDSRVYLNSSDEEDINTLLDVAAQSGVLKFIITPNQLNYLDSPIKIEHLYERSKKELMPELFSFGAGTKNLEGLQIPELGLMSEAGVIGFTDGINCIQDSLVMRRIMSYSKMFNKPVLQHPEDRSLAGLTETNSSTIKGEMNESEISTRLGLVGIPSCAEVIIIERDLRLAKLTKAHYHVSNVSTKESIEVIKRGKEEGINITCDTSPPYFSLNELELANYNTSFKLSPPLRSEKDREAIIQGIKDGVIDIITSNHQPMSNDTKLLPFSSASIGATGLETLLPMSLSLVHKESLDLKSVLKMLTYNPAKVFKIDLPKIEKNSEATFIIFDPEKYLIIDQDKLKTSPTPFNRRPAQGQIMASFIKGKMAYQNKDFRALKND